MKKLIFSFTALATVLAFSGVSALATTVQTGLDRGSGGGLSPIVKAKWEMNGPCFTAGGVWENCTNSSKGQEGTDDSVSGGAQFSAPGVWNGTMDYTVCAIVTDPNGVDDIDGVYADIYYPDGIAFHPAPADNLDEINGGEALDDPVPTTPDNILDQLYSPGHDYGVNGCSAFIEENTLHKLSKADGIDLFCNRIKNYNNNLPEFFGSSYNYDEICGATGELAKEEAFVYCDDKDLIWEDPAGDYKVEVFAQDKSGNFSYDPAGDPDSNTFKYKPLTAFAVDFTSIDYGQVLLNTHKRVSGDLTFGTGDKPTVRNTGNTRLYMGIEQDDMGLGQTSGEWNVEYDARVGNEEQDWRYYWPNLDDPDVIPPQLLEDILDLSEEEEMDFSILVTKYPNPDESFGGFMELSAVPAEFRQCD